MQDPVVSRVRARKGFMLLTAALSLIGLLAFVGLGIDIARIYVARNELQIFTDESAIAASFELDGTADGIQRARGIAAFGPGAGTTANRWNFATQTVPNVQSEFAQRPAGPFQVNPSDPAGYRFVKVQASGSVKLYFLMLVPGIPTNQTVTTKTVAGQSLETALGDGLAPFSPDAHDPADPNFGFTKGNLYTLRWAPKGQRNRGTGMCSGDLGYNPVDNSDRGYIDIGQGSGNAGLRDAIVNNTYELPDPLEIGSALTIVTGEKSIGEEIQERYNQDSDLSAHTFHQYQGNGRRLFTVAVNNGRNPAIVVGFALFFLQPSPCGGGGNTSACCAEYVGSAVTGSNRSGAGGPGIYAVELVQ